MTDATEALQPTVLDRPSIRLVDRVRPGPPEWLWGLMVALQVLVTGLLTSYTYFFADDFMFLRQAQTSLFDLTYLRSPLFEHFSPVTRVLNKVLVDVAPGSFDLARILELALYGGAILAMAFVLRTILGRSWLAFGLTILFGQSVFLLRLLTWWTATANILPATIFMLLATGGYLRWFAHRQKRWLALALGAYAIALLDYETAMVFPLNLLLVRLLVLSDSFDLREWVALVWRERYAWAGFAVLDLAALANYFHRYYSRIPHPSPGQVAHFLDISVLQTFIPGAFGIKQMPSSNTVTALATGVAFAVAWGATIYFRPRAWRSLLVLLVVVLTTLLPLGVNRVKLFGVYIGAELYYHQSAQFMFIVLVAFALSPRWGGVRDRTPAWLGRIPRSAYAVAGALAAAAYVALLFSSADTLKTEASLPRATSTYVQRVRASIRRYERVNGRANLIDLPLPTALLASAVAPFNQYSFVLPVLDLNVDYNDAARPTHVISADGSLEGVHYRLLADSRRREAVLTRSDQSGQQPAEHRGAAACVPAGPPQLLRLPLSTAESVTPRSGQLPFALRIRYQLPVPAVVPVLLSNRGGIASADFTRHLWGPGRGAQYVLVGITRRFDTIALELPGGSCIAEASLGVFQSGSG